MLCNTKLLILISMRLAQILYETSYILSFQKYKLVNRTSVQETHIHNCIVNVHSCNGKVTL